MKKSILLISTLTILLTHSYKILAQNNNLKFSGIVVDDNKSEIYNQIIVEYNTNDGFQQSGRHLIYPKINKDGRFEFLLPNLNKPYQLDMVIYNSDASKALWVNKFYTEPKDNIIMKIFLIPNEKSDSTEFSGVGNKKYNLVPILNRQFWLGYSKESLLVQLDSIVSISDLETKLDQLQFLLNGYKKRKELLLNKADINPNIRKILNNELANYNAEWNFRIHLIYNKYPKFHKELNKIYSKYTYNFYDKPDKISLFCHSYMLSLFLKIDYEMMMNTNRDYVDVSELYSYIKNNFLGQVRDQLIGNWCFYGPRFGNFAPYTFQKMDSLLKDACTLVDINYIKKAIQVKKLELNKLNKNAIFKSSFTGLDGKEFDLNNLKGKVYLIDLWFTGCTGCAIFHEAFAKEIYPKFRNNKNFSVLSISFDLQKSLWQKGINSNHYTSLDYINVFTGEGVGINHPFLKYYNVKGGPYLMLIDSKGIVSYVPQNFSVSEMIIKIQEALNKKEMNVSK